MIEGINVFNRAVSFSSSVRRVAIVESLESIESVVGGIVRFDCGSSGLPAGLLIGLLVGGLCGARGDCSSARGLSVSVSPCDRVTTGVEGIWLVSSVVAVHVEGSEEKEAGEMESDGFSPKSKVSEIEDVDTCVVSTGSMSSSSDMQSRETVWFLVEVVRAFVER
jgi:hypothetical protein